MDSAGPPTTYSYLSAHRFSDKNGTAREALIAHPTSGAITNITLRGFNRFKGEIIFFL